MGSLEKEVVANCRVCTQAKYDRHPKKQEIGETPIPSHTGEMVHIDIFSTDRKLFLTCVDKFSKFAIVQPVVSRTIVDITAPLLLYFATTNPHSTQKLSPQCSRTASTLT